MSGGGEDDGVGGGGGGVWKGKQDSFTSFVSDSFRQTFRRAMSFGDSKKIHYMGNVDEHEIDYVGFAELERIEKERRKLITFAADGGSLILLHWNSTVLHYVLVDAQFWIACIIYAICRKFDVDNYLPGPPISFSSVGVIGGLMSFLLVFFVSQSYSRFNAQYDAAMACESCIINASMLARSAMPKADAYRLVRHLNGALLCMYVGLSTVYNEENFFYPLNNRYCLLTKPEASVVVKLGMDRTRCVAGREVVAWALNGLKQCFDNGKIIVPNYIAISNNVLEFRRKFNHLFEVNDQPVPFAYTHFVYMMSVVYMPLFAYAAANSTSSADRSTSHELIGIFAVLLNNLFVLGLRGLGRKMQDPFGDELEDLSVLKYVVRCTKTTFRLLKTMENPPVDLEMELELDLQRPSLARDESLSSASASTSLIAHNSRAEELLARKGISAASKKLVVVDENTSLDDEHTMAEVR